MERAISMSPATMSKAILIFLLIVSPPIFPVFLNPKRGNHWYRDIRNIDVCVDLIGLRGYLFSIRVHDFIKDQGLLNGLTQVGS